MNRDDALDLLIETLELLVPIAKAIPALGQTVEGALEAAIKVIKFAKSVHTNKESTRELAAEAARWTEALVQALTAAPPAMLPILKAHVEEMTKVLEEIARSNTQRAKQSTISASLHKSRDADETERLRAKLRAAYERFMVGAQIRHDIALASIAEAQARSEKTLPSLISDSQSRHDNALVSIAASQARHEEVLPTLLSDADRAVLKSLSPISSARHDSSAAPSGCLEHTREDILRLLDGWVQQRTSQMSIFWLAGMAGTGKTTVARTFCDRMAKDGKLGASFFISRRDAARMDPSNIVRTMAYDLAYAVPSSRQPILEALRSFPHLMDASLEQLVPQLIASALSPGCESGNTDDVVVLVIEALDECQKIRRLEGGKLVPLLASALRNLPVKLLITSRMETSIMNMFALLAPVSVRLHDIDKDIVASDVRRYFEDSFAEIRQAHQISDSDWPSARVVDDLTNKAGHLFIYASTVVRHVGNDQHNPRTRLRQVLEPGRSSSASPYRLVDELYLQVLLSAVETTEDDEDLLCRRLRLILGAIVFFQTPLTPSAFASFLAVDIHDLTIVLRRLSAILLPVMNEPVRLFHPSFPEFIVDAARCTDLRFRLDPGEYHQVLAARSLIVMNKQLQKDICDIRDPTRINSAVSDLPERLERSVSPELRYAAIYWIHHVTSASGITTDLSEALKTFCEKHILQWLELLSLLKQLSVALKELPGLLVWAKAHSRSEDLGDVSSLLQDAIYTVRKFSSPISTSALQVYHSVLVFMPDCPLFKRASQSVVPIARMITDRGSTWNQSVDQSAIVLEGHTDEILFVAFSTDGSCILSCSWDGTARVWDASSGEQKIIFTGHEKTAIAAAFSLDEQTVTTVDQAGNVHTRDVSTGLTTGKARITFVGDIRCLAYSRDGARIISCSESTTFFIDVATHQLLRVLHLSPLRTGSVNCLKLSADGSRLYRQYSVEKEGYTREGYHLSQGHVEIWDICDETDLVHRADIGPMYRNSTLAFSADGQRAAFVNDEDDLEMVEFLQDGSTCRSTVNTWDMRETFCNIAVSSSARALVIAPSFNGEDILLVDMSSRPIAMPPQLVTLGQYPGMINCMAFSPDDARVALGSTEGLISIWNTESGRPYPSSSPCASNSRASVVKTRLSRDGLQVICTYSNGLIEINSTTTGSFVTSFHPWRTGTLPNHFLPWLCLTISPDSLRLALFNLNNSIRDGVYIWDLQAGSILVSSQSIPQQGHPVWSLDGSRCAVTVVGCRIHVLDASDGSVKADLGFPDPLEIGKEIRPHHAEFSSDGRHLLFIFREIQTDSRTENNSWTQHTCLWSTVWSIDTWMLHSVIVSCGLRVDTKQVFVPDCDEVSGFSPKGTHLVSYQPQAKLLHLRGIDDEGGIFYLVCEGNDTQIQEVMWSRDGSKVALIDSGEVLVWSTACSTTSCHLKIIFRLDLPWIPPNANHIYCLVKFSADSLRIVIPTSEDGKYSHFPLPTQPGLVTENRSVDIIVIRNSGWLLCSRADRADLVPLLWVPLERRWGEVDDVAVVGNKVAFPSVYSDSVTVLEFPSLQDLYCLFEPDHDS